ncbi:AAA family ATPase [Desulfonema magnum]|uniref:AAA ATPase-like domain-containing protein n=1 Tax=Desulfonema magnum TaxID=45655 RepID=A0A975BGT2_9BACT|nr:AAA family ATPase [Desulfonema magnum]QTA85010.1 AAA ATPase-like domain-containing protein [Desulfonema magnum]
MRLLKVHVHAYRCLEDVVINFEPDIKPQVFPIGGENGSGKSTLLQLIFALLHCSRHPERRDFLNHAIKHTKKPYEKWALTRICIAKIELLHQKQRVEFEFFLKPLSTSPEVEIGKMMETITAKRRRYREIKTGLQKVRRSSAVIDLEDVRNGNKNPLEVLTFLFQSEADRQSYEKIIQESEHLKSDLESLENELSQRLEAFKPLFLNVVNLPAEDKNYDYGLFCQGSCDDSLAKKVLDYASEHVFLAGQPTQPYLFLEDDTIQELFKSEGNYERSLGEVRHFLPNFYNYSPFSVLKILEALQDARDKDFQEVNKTGTYGNAYNSLVKELKTLLGEEKEISATPKMDAITVRCKTSGNTYLELGPEDLSHGELKRASLYSWIRHREINNAIVLIDEIENGLHPDWQYEIVRELASWGTNNQYLLATHSFYLCEALTPRHVKELEPRLADPVAKKKEHGIDP